MAWKDVQLTRSPLRVLIIGGGLGDECTIFEFKKLLLILETGGLSCAISCLRQGLSVQIVEKSCELREVNAIVLRKR